MEKISGLIIAFNEEKNIVECIRSLQTICDDVVVVDSCSSDRTVDKAKMAGALVLEQPFLGDGPQRIKGVPYCKHDWIINLDADERLEEDAISTIQSLDFGGLTDVYEIRRHNYIGLRTTRYAGQYPDYVARLFNRRTAQFTPVKAHTRVHGNKHEQLVCHIKHFSYRDYSDLFLRQCKYAHWMAEDYVSKGKKISVLSPFAHGFWTFFRHYVIKLGFLAGLDGLSISIAKATGTFLKYAYAIELRRRLM